MRGRKILVMLLGMVLILTVVACGNKETEKKSDNKKIEEEQQIQEENMKMKTVILQTKKYQDVQQAIEALQQDFNSKF